MFSSLTPIIKPLILAHSRQCLFLALGFFFFLRASTHYLVWYSQFCVIFWDFSNYHWTNLTNEKLDFKSFRNLTASQRFCKHPSVSVVSIAHVCKQLCKYLAFPAASLLTGFGRWLSFCPHSLLQSLESTAAAPYRIYFCCEFYFYNMLLAK